MIHYTNIVLHFWLRLYLLQLTYCSNHLTITINNILFQRTILTYEHYERRKRQNLTNNVRKDRVLKQPVVSHASTSVGTDRQKEGFESMVNTANNLHNYDNDKKLDHPLESLDLLEHHHGGTVLSGCYGFVKPDPATSLFEGTITEEL